LPFVSEQVPLNTRSLTPKRYWVSVLVLSALLKNRPEPKNVHVLALSSTVVTGAARIGPGFTIVPLGGNEASICVGPRPPPLSVMPQPAGEQGVDAQPFPVPPMVLFPAVRRYMMPCAGGVPLDGNIWLPK